MRLFDMKMRLLRIKISLPGVRMKLLVRKNGSLVTLVSILGLKYFDYLGFLGVFDVLGD